MSDHSQNHQLNIMPYFFPDDKNYHFMPYHNSYYFVKKHPYKSDGVKKFKNEHYTVSVINDISKDAYMYFDEYKQTYVKNEHVLEEILISLYIEDKKSTNQVRTIIAVTPSNVMGYDDENYNRISKPNEFFVVPKCIEIKKQNVNKFIELKYGEGFKPEKNEIVDIFTSKVKMLEFLDSKVNSSIKNWFDDVRLINEILGTVAIGLKYIPLIMNEHRGYTSTHTGIRDFLWDTFAYAKL